MDLVEHSSDYGQAASDCTVVVIPKKVKILAGVH